MTTVPPLSAKPTAWLMELCTETQSNTMSALVPRSSRDGLHHVGGCRVVDGIGAQRERKFTFGGRDVGHGNSVCAVSAGGGEGEKSDGASAEDGHRLAGQVWAGQFHGVDWRG